MNKINFELNERCGIYMIFNLVNGKKYVGSSVNLYDRIHQHICLLNSKKHHNLHFQAAWNKYGENNFNYLILEYCSRDNRFIYEQKWIDIKLPEYNKSFNVRGTLNVVVKPEQRVKISNTLKRKYSSGELKAYDQSHNHVKIYFYSIETLNFHSEYYCLKDACRKLNIKYYNTKNITNKIINNKYVASTIRYTDKLDIINYIYRFYKVRGKQFYLYIIDDNKIKYFKYLKELLDYFSIYLCVYNKLCYECDNIYKYPIVINNVNVYHSKEFVPYLNY